MDGDALVLLIYDALYQTFQGEGRADSTPQMFVGLQGDKIVLMQPGGEHYAVLVVPATVGAPT